MIKVYKISQISQINSLAEKDHDYLKLMIRTASLFDNVYLNQTTIGIKLGVGRQYANEISTRCGKFIIKKWRGVKKTCTYEVAPLMYAPDFIREYGHLFPGLQWCPKGLLSATSRNKATQVYKYTDLLVNNLVIAEKFSYKHSEFVFNYLNSPIDPMASAISQRQQCAQTRKSECCTCASCFEKAISDSFKA